MRAGLSFSRSPISLLLRQPLSIKKSYAGAIHPPFILTKTSLTPHIDQKGTEKTHWKVSEMQLQYVPYNMHINTKYILFFI
jgi:hypothetical protein